MEQGARRKNLALASKERKIPQREGDAPGWLLVHFALRHLCWKSTRSCRSNLQDHKRIVNEASLRMSTDTRARRFSTELVEQEEKITFTSTKSEFDFQGDPRERSLRKFFEAAVLPALQGRQGAKILHPVFPAHYLRLPLQQLLWVFSKPGDISTCLPPFSLKKGFQGRCRRTKQSLQLKHVPWSCLQQQSLTSTYYWRPAQAHSYTSPESSTRFQQFGAQVLHLIRGDIKIISGFPCRLFFD